MPSNNSGIQVGYLAGKYPNRLGWLLSPDAGWKNPPAWMPYALDNGAFAAWSNKREWDEHRFVDLLDRAKLTAMPLWVAVPDVVADAKSTIAKWHEWVPRINEISRFVLAFVVQDGMTVADVPLDAQVIFVGGTTEWKWRHLRMWTKHFNRVHVGRVNSERLLWMAHDAGAESCDGTGWFRGDQKQVAGLERYLRLSTGEDKRPQMVMDAML